MIVTTLGEVTTLTGADLGTTDWITVGQDRINTFADATDDHQWIHVDPERAKRGPFGSPIAHGYLTLSLVIPLWSELLDISGVATKVNYGLNKVRFPSPVPAGARIRAAGKLVDVQEVDRGGVQLSADIRIDIEGADKPACIAQPVFRFYP